MRVVSLFAVPLFALAASSLPAQAPTIVNVQLSNYKFTPKTIVLDRGRSYSLRLANVSGGGHDFTAPAFFSAANIAPGDRRWVAGGEVEVPPGQMREIRLTAPAPGSYKVRCTHTFHKFFGMSGSIVVR